MNNKQKTHKQNAKKSYFNNNNNNNNNVEIM
jgi:hypothetical protein